MHDPSVSEEGCSFIETKLELIKPSGEKRLLPITSYYYVNTGEKLRISQKADVCFGWFGERVQEKIKKRKGIEVKLFEISFS